MRMMIDLLLFHLISRLSVMLAIGLSIMKSMAPGKPTLNVVSTCILEVMSKKAISPKYNRKVSTFTDNLLSDLL